MTKLMTRGVSVPSNRFIAILWNRGVAASSATVVLLLLFPFGRMTADQVAGSDALPKGAVARLGTTLLRHGDGVHFAAYLPDSKGLVTASRDGTIRIWELPSGKEVRRFVPKQGAAIAEPIAPKPGPGTAQTAPGKLGPPVKPNEPVALSADGKWVAAARNREVWVWEVESGKERHALKAEVDITDLAFAGDSATLGAIGSDRSVTFWQSGSGMRLKRVRNAVAEARPANDPFSSISVLSPDLKYLAWQQVKPPFQRYIVKVVDLETGKEPFGTEAAAGPVTALAFSPNGRALLSSPADGTLQVLDLATRKDLYRGGRALPSVPAKSVVLSADGMRLGVIRATGAAEVWDIEARKRLFEVPVAKPPELPGFGLVSALLRLRTLDGVVAFSHDGQSAAIATGESAAIRVFQLDSSAEAPRLAEGHHAAVLLAQPSRDGKSLLTFARGEPVANWDRETGKVRTRIPLKEGTSRVAVSADGRYLAAASGASIEVLDAASGKPIRRFEAKDLGLLSKEIGVSALALSPNGAILATRSVAGPDIRLWDVATGKAMRTLSQATVPGAANAAPAANEASGVVSLDLAFSPDGRSLAGSGAKWQMCLWEVSSGRINWEVAFPSGQTVERFAFSPGSHCLATVDGRGTVTLYETATGQLRARLGESSSAEQPARMAVSLGGTSFAMFRAADQTACLAASPNGRYLAVSGRSPGIVLWDVLTSREVGRLEGHQGRITSLAFTANGRQLVSGGLDTAALIWDISNQLQKNSMINAGQRLENPENLWDDLAASDSAKAFAAARKFALSPDPMAAFLRTRIRPAVHAQPERIRRLVADLGEKGLVQRKSAETELIALGEQAEPELRKILEGEIAVEVRQRLERILEVATGRGGGDGVRLLRAVELLEMVGSDESQKLLETLSRGDGASRISQSAKAALERWNGETPSR